MAQGHTITVSFDPHTGYSYVDSNGNNGKQLKAKKNETVTWLIGSGIAQLELYFINHNSPFGSTILTCAPNIPFKLTGGAGNYEYITIIDSSDGTLVPPDDPEIILDGGFIPRVEDVQVAATQTGATLVFNIQVG